MTSSASIDFSAQFGGRDAAAAVMGHFRALKLAAKGLVISGCPLDVAFILRVDGQVNEYGLRGAGFPDVDPKHGYVSIDLGIPTADRVDLPAAIASGINGACSVIEDALVKSGRTVDRAALERGMEQLVEQYLAQL